jgi:hypothetical protein
MVGAVDMLAAALTVEAVAVTLPSLREAVTAAAVMAAAVMAAAVMVAAYLSLKADIKAAIDITTIPATDTQHIMARTITMATTEIMAVIQTTTAVQA